ncbi:MAG: NAD(P)-dependent oxidoreductase [Gemmatimonadaceae bacterium]
MKVSFLGLGAIGRPMARHLAAGPFGLRVWNRTASRAAVFAAAHGAKQALTPAEAARGADVVITCFPVSADVEGILEGADGLLATMSRGSVLVDCTSGDPATSRRIAERLAEAGIGFLDAPVSGGTAGAEAGTLTVMVGGDGRLLDKVRPALAAFGQRIVHCGPVGAGHAVKAVNNALLAQHIAALTEGLIALQNAGVTPALALEVINASSGRSNTSEHLFPARVLTRAFPRTFRLALLAKDARIAAQLAAEQGLDAPNLELTARLFRDAHRALGDEADHVEIVKWIERRAEVELAAVARGAGPAS